MNCPCSGEICMDRCVSSRRLLAQREQERRLAQRDVGHVFVERIREHDRTIRHGASCTADRFAMMPVLYADDDDSQLQPCRTAPRSPHRSVRLLQFTDTHLMRDPAGSIRGARTLPRLQACLAHARRHFFPVDAVLLTGDIVHDEPAAYGAIDLLFGDLGVPVLRRFPATTTSRTKCDANWVTRPSRSVANGTRATAGSCCCSSPGSPSRPTARVDSGRRSCRKSSVRWPIGHDPHALVVLHHPPVPMDSPCARRTGPARRARLSASGRTASARPRRVLGSRAPGARPLPRRRRAIHVHAGDLHAVQAAQRLRGGRPAAGISRDRPARGRLDRVRGRVAGGLPR